MIYLLIDGATNKLSTQINNSSDLLACFCLTDITLCCCSNCCCCCCCCCCRRRRRCCSVLMMLLSLFSFLNCSTSPQFSSASLVLVKSCSCSSSSFLLLFILLSSSSPRESMSSLWLCFHCCRYRITSYDQKIVGFQDREH